MPVLGERVQLHAGIKTLPLKVWWQSCCELHASMGQALLGELTEVGSVHGFARLARDDLAALKRARQQILL